MRISSEHGTKKRPRVRLPTLLILLLCVALLPCAIGVWYCATGVWNSVAFWNRLEFRWPVGPYRQYVQAVSPSGNLVATVYRYDTPDRYIRWVNVQRQSSAFDPSNGTRVLGVSTQPFVDLRWKDETTLVVTGLGLQEGSNAIHTQLSQAEPDVSIEYQFFKRAQDTLRSAVASPDGSHVAGVFERTYGFEPLTITQLAVSRVISDEVPSPGFHVLSLDHDWIPITVRGSPEMPFHWTGPKTLALDCTGIPKEDVCYTHGKIWDVTVEYVGLAGDEETSE